MSSSANKDIQKNDSQYKDTPQKYYDLTAEITKHTVTYPGDPQFRTDDVCSLSSGSPANLCEMHIGNHTGTHIDFPAHVITDGKSSSDYPIENLIGTGLIIEVPDTLASITKEFIATQNAIAPNDFVFFKTANSRISKQAPFTEKYVYIELDAAEELVKKGVKIVGVDYLSVDAYASEGLPVHHALLSQGVLIVEGLELNSVPFGRYTIYIIPNRIPGMDGLPVRVVAGVL